MIAVGCLEARRSALSERSRYTPSGGLHGRYALSGGLPARLALNPWSPGPTRVPPPVHPELPSRGELHDNADQVPSRCPTRRPRSHAPAATLQVPFSVSGTTLP